MKKVYQAEDGSIHLTERECVKHENKNKSEAQLKLEQYLVGYEGKNSKYTFSEYGTWEVRGEDPNCDFGGSHHQPYLGTFEGTYIDVVKKAVTMPHFWSWGGGGSINKIVINKV